MNLWAVIFLASIGLSTTMAASCNEAVCAPIVSKCTLMKSCDCIGKEEEESDGEDCECCEGCIACFENEWESLFTECCSCIEGLCPERNVTSEAGREDIFDFAEPDPKIWREFVKGSFPEWETVTFPTESETGRANCSVTYQRQATSMKKCLESCRTMGAKSGRWFGESGGCCECIGHECGPDFDDQSGPRCGESNVDDELDLLSDSEWDQLSDEEQEQYLESLRDEVNRLEESRRRFKREDAGDDHIKLEGLREKLHLLQSKWQLKLLKEETHTTSSRQ